MGKRRARGFPNCGSVERVSCEVRGTAGRKPGILPETSSTNDVKEAVNLPGPVLVIEKACKAAVLDLGNTILQ
jgi:hypothetical protein